MHWYGPHPKVFRQDRHVPGHGQGLCRSPVAVAVLGHNLNIVRMTVFQINCSWWVDHRLLVLLDEIRSGEPQIYLASFAKIRALWLVPPVIQKKGKQNLLSGIEWVTPLFNSNHSTTLDVAISKGGVDFGEQINDKNLQYFVDAQNYSVVEMLPPPSIGSHGNNPHLCKRTKLTGDILRKRT